MPWDFQPHFCRFFGGELGPVEAICSFSLRLFTVLSYKRCKSLDVDLYHWYRRHSVNPAGAPAIYLVIGWETVSPRSDVELLNAAVAHGRGTP